MPATHRALATLALLCALHPATASACAIVSKERAAQLQQERIERSKADALALKEEADLIFIGRLSQLSYERETVTESAGREVVLQKHWASFDLVHDTIKGNYTKGQVLEFTTNKNRVVISCDGTAFRSSLPRENGASETYLVYARDGKILRTNLIPADVQPLRGYEEAKVLRDGR